MPLVTNTTAGNFLVDGAYISLVSAQPVTPVGPQTDLIAVDGGANWGKLNTPLPFVDASSAIQQFGNDTSSTHSLLREALNAMPECTSFLGNRVDDGTSVAATIVVADASGGVIETMTAVCTGTYPNGVSSVTLQIQSGDVSGTSGPLIVRATVTFPNAQPQVFNNIACTPAGTGAYSAAAFHANFKAAINGTVANQVGSLYYTDTNGASALPPKFGFAYLASGGTNGGALSSANLIGTDGSPGTGIYAFRSLVSAAQVVVAFLTDATMGQTLNSFAVQENCIVWLGFPSLTPTLTELNTIQAQNLVADSLFLASDWDYMYDSIQGLTVLTSPIGKLAGKIAATPTFQYPGNQGGAVGVSATDRINGGASSINFAEQGQRETAGILYLGYMPQAPRGPQLGLPHGMTTTGRLISDVRMTKSIAFSLQQLLGQYVGGMMNPNNINSLTIQLVNNAIDGFFQNLMSGQTPQIAAYQNITNSSNNTTISIEQGFIICAISVQTLSAARFILAFVQVGNTVQVVVATPPGT